MNNRITNPFKILGLDKDLVKRLKDDQLRMLIQKQYLALQQIYHPDKGGSSEASSLLNWAKEQLQDKTRFEQWKKNYCRTGSRKGVSEKALQRALNDMSGFSDYFFNMCLALARRSEEDQYIDLLGLGSRRYVLARPSVNVMGSLMLPKKDRERPFFQIFIRDGRLMLKARDGKEMNYSSHLLLGLVDQQRILKVFGVSKTIGGFFHHVRKGAPLLTFEESLERSSSREDLVTNLMPGDFMAILPYLDQQVTFRQGFEGKECLNDGHLFSFSLEGGGKFCYEGSLCKLA